jgi:hypothetical protein
MEHHRYIHKEGEGCYSHHAKDRSVMLYLAIEKRKLLQDDSMNANLRFAAFK